ncbi:DNA polymerase III subunit gamma/tau [Candidatus Phytoplasma pini]|uniref:DNA polymerase III subunit gamma/tau n=1 Tax=Candidatus Phytoplasma pini TaxID=267362 RepID=A0A559KJS6_9MOLU|nr:DNA polymerase III subunit gamma/tau [Candidatus Phytoplasma pini]TVY12381.1 DNA polymerase III, tau subunit [Candidatus Phytoplasma pini]
MSYISLYRKYRPKNFQDMVGQKIIIQILQNILISKKIGHFYLFSGGRGVGKTTLAKIFAKGVNCLQFKNQDCCNVCDACNAINQKNCLDVIEIDGASYSGVDDIRELQDIIKYANSVLKYKICIIDEVHVLSSNAFNALLKLLEEPPMQVIFILITSELNKIPTTISSRSQKFLFLPLSQQDILQQLKKIVNKEKICITDESLDKIAFYANHSLRDALNLLDQISSYKKDLIEEADVENMLGIFSNSKIKQLVKLLNDANIKKIISFLEENLTLNIDLVLFVDDFIDYLLTEFINFAKIKRTEEKKIFDLLNFEKRDKFFKILFDLKKILLFSNQKKNIIIYNIICLYQLIWVSEQISPKLIKNSNFDIEIDNQNFILRENEIKTKEESKKSTFRESFIHDLKEILSNSCEKTKKKFDKAFEINKEKYEKSNSGDYFLYNKSKILIVSTKNKVLLSCDDSDVYRELLKSRIKEQIKSLFNKKTNLIKDYLVILEQDWKEKLEFVYKGFLQNQDIVQLQKGIANFVTNFYEENSPLNIEQEQNAIIKTARDFFGFDKVKVVD